MHMCMMGMHMHMPCEGRAPIPSGRMVARALPIPQATCFATSPSEGAQVVDEIGPDRDEGSSPHGDPNIASPNGIRSYGRRGVAAALIGLAALAYTAHRLRLSRGG